MAVLPVDEKLPQITFLGRLRDFGLGNPQGIPSELATASDTQLTDYGEKILQAIDNVDDFKHYACIDGRDCLTNSDGSAANNKRRQVGGTLLWLETAMNAESSLLDSHDLSDGLENAVNVINGKMTELTGINPSAHSGGCGGANGAIDDNYAIANIPAVINTVKAVMNIPAMSQASGLEYDEVLGQEVRRQAFKTAGWLKNNGWNGDEQVEAVKQLGIENIEELKTDHDKFHGHKESSIILLLSRDGTNTISKTKLHNNGLGDAFVVNIDASINDAAALSGNRGEDGKKQALIANLAKHMAVASRLANLDTPVFFIHI